MRWRGEGVLGTEVICFWMDLRTGLHILTIQPPQRTLLECVLSFMLKAHSFMCIAAVCKILLYLLIMNSSWKQSSCITSLRCGVKSVCTWYSCFWYLLLKTALFRSFFRQPTALFVWKMPPSAPPLVGSKPAHWSIPTTMEIVIDLPYLGPVARRSHLLSLPYWKGKHSWCYKPKCSVLGCSVGAMCLVLSPMMDGENSGYTFTPSHPTCSSVGGDWLSLSFFLF